MGRRGQCGDSELGETRRSAKAELWTGNRVAINQGEILSLSLCHDVSFGGSFLSYKLCHWNLIYPLAF